MDVTTDMVEEFKNRMHISHSAEDDHLESMLLLSASALKAVVGDFNLDENDRAKELVFERTRYAYNDALEYFEDNFLSELTGLGLSLAFEKEGDDDS